MLLPIAFKSINLLPSLGPIPAKEPAVMSKEALNNACVPI